MKKYFKGFYYKIQSASGTIAFIPSISIDRSGDKKAAIQVVAKDFADCAYYDIKDYYEEKKDSLPYLRIGGSEFSDVGIKINIDTGIHAVSGDITFGKLLKPKYDIMGPFSLLPYMECRHSVYSLRHNASGSIAVDGNIHNFTSSLGYIEGDSGRSFPSKYLWTQCLFDNGSLMLSVAEIPLIRTFTGIIGTILIDGKELRLATYLGAKAAYIGKGKTVVTQGKYTFMAELLDKSALALHAPQNGEMTRFIHENLSSPARYILLKDGKTILELESNSAGFEYEYDI